MSGWNFADVWEAVAAQHGEATAQNDGTRQFTWSEFDARANGIANALLKAGCQHQEKFAQLLYNVPEYLESVFAAFKAGLVPVNTNYRYGSNELLQVWEDADVTAVVFDSAFIDVCNGLRDKLPVRIWICVVSEGDECPSWAVPYEDAAASHPARVVGSWGRSGDDLLFLYTGGTTGLPKGVMWAQHDLFRFLEKANRHPLPGVPSAEEFVAGLQRLGPRILPGAPLMHGTSLFFALPVLSEGGSVHTSPKRHFNAREFLDFMEAHGIQGTSIVGDAFARPIVEELDHQSRQRDLSRMRVILSAGVLFSADIKERLIQYMPKVVILDGLGSSETGTLASTLSKAGEVSPSGKFFLGDEAFLIDEDGKRIEPGSGKVGRMAVAGLAPLGYYKDPKKSAETFIEIDGERYTISGDWAEASFDGSVRFLGRGSSCINTGGEKVYPEEVEEVIRRRSDIKDVAVVGVPDKRFGEVVTALIESSSEEFAGEEELRSYVRESLAGYKVPKHIIRVDSLGRTANGKIDYKVLKALAANAVAASSRPTK
jgi:3-oxocholest-4-en-26-oate---CoA ligase